MKKLKNITVLILCITMLVPYMNVHEHAKQESEAIKTNTVAATDNVSKESKNVEAGNGNTPLTAKNNDNIVYSGSDFYVSWTIDNRGTLSVYGNYIPDYDKEFNSWEAELPPWQSYTEHVNAVVIGEDIEYIGAYAFYNCHNLNNMVIPASVKEIDFTAFSKTPVLNKAKLENGVYYIDNVLISANVSGTYTVKEGTTCMFSHAFYENTELTEINLPKSIRWVSDASFYGCTSLTKVNLPSTLEKIGISAFNGCTALEEINIPETVRSIGSYAFNNTSLTSVTLPEGITAINNALFQNSKLASINIPDTVTYIGKQAFENTNLSSVIIPDSVTNVESKAFAECSSLTSVKLSKNLYSVSADIFYNSSCIESDGYAKYVDCLLLSAENDISGEYTVKEGTVYICSSAFRNAALLTGITIPEGVTLIGDHCFDQCSSLTYANLPTGLKKINKGLFSHCTALYSIVIPEGVTAIETDAFSLVPLSSITIPSTLRNVKWNVGFTNKLKTIYINDIGGWCSINFERTNNDLTGNPLCYVKNFYVNGKATSNIVIPEGVTTINNSFENFQGLKTITLPSTITSIGTRAFYKCENLTTINCESPITAKIGDYAFYECKSLEAIELGEGVTYIGESAFDSCGQIKAINIPDSVTEIGKNAFEGCYYLKQISLSKNITEIPEYCFRYTAIESIEIPNSVTTIGNNAFESTYYLTNVIIPESVTCVGKDAFDSSGAYTIDSSGVLYVDKCLLKVNSNSTLKSYTVAEGTTVIAMGAFSNCKTITEIVLPNSVTHISPGAFSSCKTLETINIPDSITRLEGGTFSNCTALKNIVLPETITYLGNSCIYNCTSLTSINIPSSVSEIESFVLSGCTNLKSVYISSLENWCNIYQRELDMPNNEYELYYNNEKLTDLYIPETIEYIRAYTFARCSSLENVIIPSSTKSIGSSAFERCPNLKTVTIPNNVTGIESSAFIECTEDLIIKCYYSSYAHRYALRNNIKFELLDKQTFDFPDVPADAWYAEGVKYCAEKFYITGTDKGTFEPNAVLTREQFVVILARHADVDLSKYKISKFTDVDATSWYGPSVIWANQSNIVNGINDGSNFGTGQSITREQLATMFLRYAQYKNISITGKGDLSLFKDGNKVSSWAKDAVEWTVHTALLGSTSTTEMILAPQMSVTRAQAAKIFMYFSR